MCSPGEELVKGQSLDWSLRLSGSESRSLSSFPGDHIVYNCLFDSILFQASLLVVVDVFKNTERIASCKWWGAYFSSTVELSSCPSVSLVLFSPSLMSDSLWPHGRQHTRLPGPSPSLGVCSNSYPLSCWCHPAISPSGAPSPPTLHLSQHQGLFQWVSFIYSEAHWWMFVFFLLRASGDAA